MHQGVIKRALFWLILLLVPVVFCVALVLGRYAYGKLTFTAHFCAPFSQLDDQIGWVHKPNVESCMGTHAEFDRSQVYYERAIYTDENGFRSARSGEETPRNAVVFMGDSFTFGYMAPYEDSFAALFADLTNEPVVNMGSPAYSGAQAVRLAQRWVKRLEPKALVYFETGFWERGVCEGETRPTFLLKPCYWVRPDGTAELILPPEGQVTNMAAWGLRPGGMVGAGEVTWAYFLISRPVAKVHQILVRLGLTSGMPDDFLAVGKDTAPARRALLNDLLDLAKSTKTPLLLLDSKDVFNTLVDELAVEDRQRLLYVDGKSWQAAVLDPASKLPLDQVEVPHDRHFAVGANRLIAELIRAKLADVLR
jgi:hypothetical protein